MGVCKRREGATSVCVCPFGCECVGAFDLCVCVSRHCALQPIPRHPDKGGTECLSEARMCTNEWGGVGRNAYHVCSACVFFAANFKFPPSFLLFVFVFFLMFGHFNVSTILLFFAFSNIFFTMQNVWNS